MSYTPAHPETLLQPPTLGRKRNGRRNEEGGKRGRRKEIVEMGGRVIC